MGPKNLQNSTIFPQRTQDEQSPAPVGSATAAAIEQMGVWHQKIDSSRSTFLKPPLIWPQNVLRTGTVVHIARSTVTAANTGKHG